MAEISVETEKLFYAFGFCYTETENTEIDFGFLLKEQEFWPKGIFRQKISVPLLFRGGGDLSLPKGGDKGPSGGELARNSRQRGC